MSSPVAKKIKTGSCPMATLAPQAVTAKLTTSAVFLIAKLAGTSPEITEQVRGVLGDLGGLVRGVGFRSQHGGLTCIAGIGSSAWDALYPDKPRPRSLHPFKEFKGAKHTAPATPGADLLFHIRAERHDVCFELARVVVDKLDGAATVIDEVHGFKYFDARDLLGFVDGTENPQGQAAKDATLVQESDDPEYAGSSYVIVQKYLHDLKKWNKESTEEQQRVIGREKLSDIELEDDDKPSYAHNVLTDLDDDPETGEPREIVRDNMPFGEAGKQEYGTYFIAYSRKPEWTEEMLQNMFIGKPEGNYDHILDYSTAKTGALFFVPPSDFVDE